mmetsp:Transcript_35138/g.85531  ORF Transcript_35138/g.85531 Transcript_35138/m.85531 type:complete len:281 (-) Transcript_35138:74-916(-)
MPIDCNYYNDKESKSPDMFQSPSKKGKTNGRPKNMPKFIIWVARGTKRLLGIDFVYSDIDMTKTKNGNGINIGRDRTNVSDTYRFEGSDCTLYQSLKSKGWIFCSRKAMIDGDEIVLARQDTAIKICKSDVTEQAINDLKATIEDILTKCLKKYKADICNGADPNQLDWTVTTSRDKWVIDVLQNPTYVNAFVPVGDIFEMIYNLPAFCNTISLEDTALISAATVTAKQEAALKKADNILFEDKTVRQVYATVAQKKAAAEVEASKECQAATANLKGLDL